MRINSVELENIKSYQRLHINLGPGTTAIRGSNGAGKSTLVEAIGFALFDALPYKQAQFVREGERVGVVTITFTSALDDREYQAVRRCGSSSDWYIYDPDLHDRVVEQKADVIAFLRQHLRIESDLDLNTLFNDAIGVPQGTFTADFLQTPGARKKKFDVLLQVEDYRTAFDKLLATSHYLREQQIQQDNQIAALERETAQLDNWRAQFEQGRTRERMLTETLARLLRETETLEAERKALEERKQHVTALQNEVNVAQAEHRAAESQRMEAERQLAEAADATRICAESRPDHDAFLATEKQLATARGREQQRSQLREERAQAALAQEGTRKELAHSQEQLMAAEQAARELAKVEPKAERQRTREDERTAARQRVARRDELATTRQRTEGEWQAAQQACAQDERQIARLEQLRPEAGAIAERRGQLEAAQTAQATWQTNSDRLQAVRQQLPEKQAQREKKAQLEQKAAANLRKIVAQQAVVESFPALEAEQKTLDGKIRQTQARIEQHRLSRQQSGMGNCPFLREPCLNIQQRGENSLISYFDRMIADAERELAPLEEHAHELAARIDHARTVLSYWDRRGEFEEKQREAADDRERLEHEIAALTAEQRQLDATLANGHDARTLERLRAAYDRSNDAAMQCARLPDIQAHLRESSDRRDTLAAELERMAHELAGLESAPADLQRIEAELDALGDPRGLAASLRATAADISNRAERVEKAKTALRRCDAQLAECDKRLAPFAALDDELARLEDARARTSEGHLRYLRYEHLAAQHGERKKAYAAAEQATRAAATRHTKATRDYEQAAARFDGARLATVVARSDAVRREHGECTAELRQTQQDSARLASEIARVEALLIDLNAAREERQTLDDLDRMLKQFRDIIKEAGPNILRAQLHAISREANRIFGEILGDRSAELAWEADYEIVLRRDGRERTFAQLSGGEQMSAALAVRLALLRRLSRLDLAFFDEPTQNMDGERRGNLAEQIRRVRGFDQLLVISHDDTFEQGLDGVIHLEKRNGQTVIAEHEPETLLSV
ncbi:MAG TPA: SMC family ATPase [Ktedonobacterales bacterium]|nr:SMC family ATPase [Ktedonobacterales bacterium]